MRGICGIRPTVANKLPPKEAYHPLNAKWLEHLYPWVKWRAKGVEMPLVPLMPHLDSPRSPDGLLAPQPGRSGRKCTLNQ
jgi:hypothetical protein